MEGYTGQTILFVVVHEVCLTMLTTNGLISHGRFALALYLVPNSLNTFDIEGKKF